MDPELADRDFASLVLGSLDYEAQLAAIRGLLGRHREVDEQLSATIARIDREARQLRGIANQQWVDDWLEHMHASVFQDAAHSMAAVGMLAPLIESIFKSAFRGIHRLLTERGDPVVDQVRTYLREDRRWDIRFARRGGADSSQGDEHVVRGIVELIEAVELRALLPAGLDQTLEALFSYRNRMFHLGFEWPHDERQRFEGRCGRDWPIDWFAQARTGSRPWMFYMSDVFVDHCLVTVDGVLEGLGRFVRRHPMVVAVDGLNYDYDV